MMLIMLYTYVKSGIQSRENIKNVNNTMIGNERTTRFDLQFGDVMWFDVL